MFISHPTQPALVPNSKEHEHVQLLSDLSLTSSNFHYSGPDDGLFMRFKNCFGQLDRNDLHLWEWPNDPQSPAAIQATLVLHWAEQHCASATFPRADYRELCELLVAVLGGQVCI